MHGPYNVRPLPGGSARVPVMGIAEWWNWYAGDAQECDQPTAIDECIEVHRALGVEQIERNCGRAVVGYNTELPQITRAAAHPESRRPRAPRPVV